MHFMRRFLSCALALALALPLSCSGMAFAAGEQEQAAAVVVETHIIVPDDTVGGHELQPDAGITIAEAIALAEEAFGDAENLPDWGWWKSQSSEFKPWNRTWGFNTDVYWLQNADTRPVSREFAAYIILQINGEASVPHPEFYGAAKYSFYTAYLTACAKGYSDVGDYSTDDAKAFVTAGEYRDLIEWAKEHVHDEPVLPDVDGIVTVDTSQAEGVEDLEDKVAYIRYELSAIPVEFRESFAKYGFSVQIVNDEHWHERFDRYTTEDTSGWFVPAEKAIAIHEKYFDSEMTLDHEFGHYIDWHFNYAPSKACVKLKNDKREAEGLSQAARREYCMTDELEYFADAYWSYLVRKDELKDYAPKTYKLVEDTLAGTMSSK